MTENPSENARDKLVALAQNPAYTPYVIGYLVSGLRVKDMEDLVQAALEFREEFPVEPERYRRALLNVERWARE